MCFLVKITFIDLDQTIGKYSGVLNKLTSETSKIKFLGYKKLLQLWGIKLLSGVRKMSDFDYHYFFLNVRFQYEAVIRSQL
jgi:hypothetical protein